MSDAGQDQTCHHHRAHASQRTHASPPEMDAPNAPADHARRASAFGLLLSPGFAALAMAPSSDEHRDDIEPGALDSTAVRLSWESEPLLGSAGLMGRCDEPRSIAPR